jgi:hypothetical protein
LLGDGDVVVTDCDEDGPDVLEAGFGNVLVEGVVVEAGTVDVDVDVEAAVDVDICEAAGPDTDTGVDVDDAALLVLVVLVVVLVAVDEDESAMAVSPSASVDDVVGGVVDDDDDDDDDNDEEEEEDAEVVLFSSLAAAFSIEGGSCSNCIAAVEEDAFESTVFSFISSKANSQHHLTTVSRVLKLIELVDLALADLQSWKVNVNARMRGA